MTTERFAIRDDLGVAFVPFGTIVDGLKAISYTGVSVVGAQDAKIDVTVAEKVNRATLLVALQRITGARV